VVHLGILYFGASEDERKNENSVSTSLKSQPVVNEHFFSYLIGKNSHMVAWSAQ
jgi:hypothetical protein